MGNNFSVNSVNKFDIKPTALELKESEEDRLKNFVNNTLEGQNFASLEALNQYLSDECKGAEVDLCIVETSQSGDLIFYNVGNDEVGWAAVTVMQPNANSKGRVPTDDILKFFEQNEDGEKDEKLSENAVDKVIDGLTEQEKKTKIEAKIKQLEDRLQELRQKEREVQEKYNKEILPKLSTVALSQHVPSEVREAYGVYIATMRDIREQKFIAEYSINLYHNSLATGNYSVLESYNAMTDDKQLDTKYSEMSKLLEEFKSSLEESKPKERFQDTYMLGYSEDVLEVNQGNFKNINISEYETDSLEKLKVYIEAKVEALKEELKAEQDESQEAYLLSDPNSTEREIKSFEEFRNLLQEELAKRNGNYYHDTYM